MFTKLKIQGPSTRKQVACSSTFQIPSQTSSLYKVNSINANMRMSVAQRFFSADPAEHKKAFQTLAQKFNVQKPEAWFKVKTTDAVGQASDLLKPYGNSLFTALSAVFPEQANTWKDKRNHRAYFESLTKQLNLSKPEDWYGVKLADAQAIADFGLIDSQYNGSLIRALEDVYPEINWNKDKFDETIRAREEFKIPRRKKATASDTTAVVGENGANGEASTTGTGTAANKEKLQLPNSPTGINYTLRRGKPRGVPTCRGCKRPFEDKSELRIQTTLMYEAPGLEPRPVVVNFCISQYCVQAALKNYRKKESVIHPFDGRVEVAPEVPRNEVPQAEGVTFVFP